MVNRLTGKFQDMLHQKLVDLMVKDVPDDNSESNKLAMIAFLQRIVPHWFMRLFASRSRGAI